MLVAVLVGDGVGVGVGVVVAVGVGVFVGVGVGVLVAVGVGVGVPEPPGISARKEVIVAFPPWVRKRMPQKPDVNELSLAVAIQPVGSPPEDAQTLVARTDPTTRKWIE